MKIVILDAYTENPGDLSCSGLEKLGDLTIYDRTSLTDETEIISRIGDAEIVLTNKTPVTRSVIESCPKLRFIAILATGYNIVDCACAREHGIPVSNVPAYGTAAVAQYAVALLLEVCCGVGRHSDSVHRGDWERSRDFCYWENPVIELNGKTIGIIGFGRIGQTVGAITKAMGMRVLACSPHPSEAGRAIAEYVSLDTLLAESDVISLHCPLFPETKEIINRESIAKMKDGVILVNNGRGGLVNERDLADALNSGKVYSAAVDVVSAEPIKSENPLLHAKNCFITPHISWTSKECRQRVMDCTEKNVRAFLDGVPVNVVNQ